eukprot:4605239-Prymnesium_polylepis.1
MAGAPNMAGAPPNMAGAPNMADAPLIWQVRTSISEAEARDWAALATVCSAREKLVWVAFFNDGGINHVEDPHTGAKGFEDWGFNMIKLAVSAAP